jgi:phosphoglycerate dehydrogenase-like enzyme
MGNNIPHIVIVPDSKGVEALAGIKDIKVLMIEPNKPIPTSANTATVLVVGPAEKQNEVDNALRQINQLPEIKLLQTLGQGIEQWEGLLPSDLTVSTARGAHGGSTAEWVVAALLSLTRELPLYIKNQQLHLWRGHRTRTLQSAHIIVYGAGDLGQNVRSRLLPFGTEITMVGTHSRDNVIDIVTAYALLPTVDAVIMALPLNTETRNIVDADFLGSLCDGAIFINAGRGGLVDNEALLKELHSGRIVAALDVVTPEPLPPSSLMWDAPGLLLTPHIGGNTTGADDRAWKIASERINSFLHGDLHAK